MIGGKNGEKNLRDLWKFDFENVQPQGPDLVGVVAEQIYDKVPFDANMVTATEEKIICTSKLNEVWIFDFKVWTKLDLLFPQSIGVFLFEDKLCLRQE